MMTQKPSFVDRSGMNRTTSGFWFECTHFVSSTSILNADEHKLEGVKTWDMQQKKKNSAALFQPPMSIRFAKWHKTTGGNGER